MNGMDPALGVTAFLAGLLGSGHCFGMCGGIAGSLGALSGASNRGVAWPALQFNLGRLLGYALLGALAGGILGAAGEILSLKQILDLLAEISGRPKVRMRIPHEVAFAWAYVDVALAKILPGYTPQATPEKVKIAKRGEGFDSSKAVRELGLPQMPARVALQKAVEWYRANGYWAG